MRGDTIKPANGYAAGKPLIARRILPLDGETDGVEHGWHMPRFGVYLALGRNWNLMFVTYTQMDKTGTRRMHRLGLPLYAFALFVCLVTSGRGAIWFFGALTVVGFMYTFLYSRLYVHFMAHPELPGKRFTASLIFLQVAIGLLLAAAAA